MFNFFKNKNTEIANLNKAFAKSHDFKCIEYFNNKSNISFTLKFLATLIDEKAIQDSVLPYLLEENFKQIDDVKHIIPLADIMLSENISEIEERLFSGYVVLMVNG